MRLLIVPLIALFTFVALLIVDIILKHYESGGGEIKGTEFSYYGEIKPQHVIFNNYLKALEACVCLFVGHF